VAGHRALAVQAVVADRRWRRVAGAARAVVADRWRRPAVAVVRGDAPVPAGRAGQGVVVAPAGRRGPGQVEAGRLRLVPRPVRRWAVGRRPERRVGPAGPT
jgi:hypothetical protein